MMLQVQGAVLTHRGKVRAENEDACLFGKVFGGVDMDHPEMCNIPPSPSWILAVADGIGGMMAGARASRELVEALAGCTDAAPDGITRVLGSLNRRFSDAGRTDSEAAGMGATVAGIFFGSQGAFAFNVGDSRVYRQRDSFLAQITKDDSVAAVLDKAGVLDTSQPRPSNVHGITQAIGGKHEYAQITPHFYALRTPDRARFLLCTDGLTDYLSLDDLEQACSRPASPPKAAEALRSRLWETACGDNVTIVVADVL